MSRLLGVSVCEFWVLVSSAVIDCGEPEPMLNGGVTFISGSQNQHLSVIQYHCNEPFYSLPEGHNIETKIILIFFTRVTSVFNLQVSNLL